MKKFLLFSFVLLFTHPLFAQKLAPSRTAVSIPLDIRSRLVELALQNPQLEVADRQISIAKYNLKSAKGWWANNISLSFNANQYSLKRLGKQSATPAGQYTSTLYPLYNVGINIPIGGLLTKPAEVKADRERVAIAQASRNSTYRQIRAAVLTAYEDYLAKKKLYTLQSQVTESNYNEYLQAKQKFRNGQISLTEYNEASAHYHEAIKSNINAEHNYNLTKIQLEALIGKPISQVVPHAGEVAAPADSTKAQ